ncbi:NAD(P)-dependent oxidoreductase [Leifsonia sp. AG29]|uniref:NAD(P)-dependent oxidoreductase n=1 Tax=Leifsonia sp. AG29 TaxID=2598860 RepID=UPI00131DCFFC|nr:NAD(P)-dependent oxidoreductase [Leifsonia sp. AG29]
MKILLPDTIELSVTGRHDIIVYDVTQPLSGAALDAEVLVVWQNPQWQLEHAARAMNRLRLVQTLASGPDAVMAAGFGSNVLICSGRSLHDGPVAEHTLALILTCVRRLDRLRDAQRNGEWDSDFVAAQSAADTRALYTLAGAKVLLWGFGSIAATLEPLLTALGAEVIGVGRTAGYRNETRVIAQDAAENVLPEADVLVSLVPATPATTDLFDRRLFSTLKRGAIFVNVGRGATVDEVALADALSTGQLRAAAIDVAKVEPIAPDSPLWQTPNLVISPHVAGNRPVRASELVQANIDRLETGRDLINRQPR